MYTGVGGMAPQI